MVGWPTPHRDGWRDFDQVRQSCLILCPLKGICHGVTKRSDEWQLRPVNNVFICVYVTALSRRRVSRSANMTGDEQELLQTYNRYQNCEHIKVVINPILVQHGDGRGPCATAKLLSDAGAP